MKKWLCPICKKPVPPGSADFPFCSERCRLIDLGNWASEKYRVPAEPAEPDPNAPDEE